MIEWIFVSKSIEWINYISIAINNLIIAYIFISYTKSSLLYIMYARYPDWVLPTCTRMSMYTTLAACIDPQVGSNDQRFHVCITVTIINNIASSCIATFWTETVLTICRHSQLWFRNLLWIHLLHIAILNSKWSSICLRFIDILIQFLP